MSARLGNCLDGWTPVGIPLAGIIALSSLLSVTSAADSHPPVSPGQAFPNPILQVHAPNSTGWYGAEEAQGHITFGKKGPNPDESFIAAVALFRIPAFQSSDVFTEFVRQGLLKDSPPDRFETIESNLQLTTDRGYPCVHYHSIAKDKKARISAFSKRELTLEIVALYCEHPTKPNLGFSVSYSHRGGNPADKIADDAASFIDSVQVTPPGKPPATD